MKKVFITLITLIISFIIILAFTPKFLIIDKILMKNKVFIMPESVSEGIFSINLKKANVYYNDKLVIKDSDIDLQISPLYQGLNLFCQSKKSQILHKTFGGYYFKFDNFKCLEGFESVNGEVEIKEGVVGKLILKNFKADNRNFEFLEFLFKGKSFDFKGRTQAVDISGSGVVSFDQKNPLNSKLNATASAIGFNFVISGTITNLQFKTQ
ncbi:hypothetical protein [Sulfurihydrogenibium subterraneum]|uniref:hypothetical protein n=1 Tax=Sulfurihydrogenibium subterraneum TaxID=171121 RepID=UPI00048C4DEF|nr:hypothetical protein [Sulfurihydrogenibium subterraneum]